MAHQEGLTVLAEVGDERVDALRRTLGTIREHGGAWHVVPFAKLPRLHFGQFFILDAARDVDGHPLPARLGLLTNIDAPLDAHLDDLSTIAGEGIDAVFSHCEDYPAACDRTPAARRTFLERHSFPSNAVHINRRGRTVRQIQQEEFLRRELNAHLDRTDLRGLSSLAIRQRLVEFVRGRSDLAWALEPPAPPSLAWRLKELAHGVFYGLLTIALAPLWLLALPIFALLLRRHERLEVPDRSAAPAHAIRALRDDEDYWAHNQFVAAGSFKRGRFRRFTTGLILGIADYGTRHIYNRGVLSGLNTIHFARWVEFDGGRRMVFSSNYDGSIESYMNDFIDKAAWGVNAIFSNGDGFPATTFMVRKGITDEKAYKRFLPTRLVNSNVWYSAYPHLTTQNIANNEAIRRGLSVRMDEAGARQWLKRFGTGNRPPASGWAARLLDSLPWDKICRSPS